MLDFITLNKLLVVGVLLMVLPPLVLYSISEYYKMKAEPTQYSFLAKIAGSVSILIISVLMYLGISKNKNCQTNKETVINTSYKTVSLEGSQEVSNQE